MKAKYLLTNYKSELIFMFSIMLLLMLQSYIMLPVATHGEINPICDVMVGDHIMCTTSP